MGIVAGVFGDTIRYLLCDRIPLAFKRQFDVSGSIVFAQLLLIQDWLNLLGPIRVPLRWFPVSFSARWSSILNGECSGWHTKPEDVVEQFDSTGINRKGES